MKKIKANINLGKYAVCSKKRINAVTLEVELCLLGGEETKVGKCVTYTEFTACASVWNATHSNTVMGGQCLDTLNEYDAIARNGIFRKVYAWWKLYHLNGAHAGMPEQEEIVKAIMNGNRYDYNIACNVLKEAGMYEVPYRDRKTVGLPHDPNDMYEYGHGWVIKDIPANVQKEMIDFIIENGQQNITNIDAYKMFGLLID